MGGLFLGPSIPYLPDTVNVRFFTLRLIGLGRRHLQKKTKKKRKDEHSLTLLYFGQCSGQFLGDFNIVVTPVIIIKASFIIVVPFVIVAPFVIIVP